MPEQALQRIEYRLAPNPDEVEPTVLSILDHIRAWGLSDERSEGDLHLALDEALTNAVLHGVLRIEPEYRQRGVSELLAEASARAARAPYVNHRVLVLLESLTDAVRITIDDGGPGYDVAHVPPDAPPDAIGGRGLMLIRSCMDAVHHNASGNRITMLKRFAPADSNSRV